MNQYGQIAMDHWKKWLPRRFKELEDPEAYFATLGEEISDEVAEMARSLAGPDPKGEGYLAKVGRLNMARANAESQVLRERALLEPESGQEKTPTSV